MQSSPASPLPDSFCLSGQLGGDEQFLPGNAAGADKPREGGLGRAGSEGKGSAAE